LRRRLEKKRVIITGATSGIGLALAEALGDEGCRLIINGRRAERLDAIQQQLQAKGVECASVAGDVTQKSIRQQMLDTAQSQFGGLDILINNAGIGAMGRFDTACF